MKIYSFEKHSKCFLIGSADGNIDKVVNDIIKRLPNQSGYVEKKHPKEIEREKRLKEAEAREENNRPNLVGTFGSLKKMMKRPSPSEKLDSSVIILSGNSGFGSKNINYYIDKLDELNRLLEKNNSHLLIIRGSFDDPQFFENESLSMTNIKTIPDYSVIVFETFNCLCIGGSISIDREWKKEHEKRINRKLYWENEGFEYKKDEINDILNQFDITCIITNTCPSFSYPGINTFKNSSWARKDKNLSKDVLRERKLMDKVYKSIVEKDKKPYVWFYSSFLSSNKNFMNDICFQSMGPRKFYSFNEILEKDFGVSQKKNEKLTFNKKSIDKLISAFNEINRHNGNDWAYVADADAIVDDEPNDFGFDFEAGNGDVPRPEPVILQNIQVPHEYFVNGVNAINEMDIRIQNE